MSEKDIQQGIVVIPPKYSLPVTSSQSEPKFIDVTVKPLKTPYNAIIYSKTENIGQFVITAQSINEVVEKTGEDMPLNSLGNATTVTGDITVEVQNIPLPETLRSRKIGLISNERGTVAWQGENTVIITSIHTPTNPITGERLASPNQKTESTALPSAYNITQVSQPQITTIENPASQHDADLARNPFLQPLKKAA